MDDLKLLKEYATRNSQEAFATLVQRHIGLVYSAALRQLRDPHLAEEISQVVFIILAKKSGELRENTILSGWLYRTTRFACADALKKLQRRQRREQEAYMQSTVENPDADSAWQEIEPHLDDALTQLGETDRNALVLRFFENRNLREVGLGLGVSEVAAQKRIARALAKLRALLLKRETVLPVSVLIATLSANAAQAAPAGLAATVATTAAAKGVVAGASTLTFIKGTLKIMAWTKMKTAAVVGAAVILGGGTTAVMVNQLRTTRNDSETFQEWQVRNFDARILQTTPPQVMILPARFPHSGSSGFAYFKMMGFGQTVRQILTMAYEIRSSRIVTTEVFPNEKYDFISNLPNGSKEALQKKVKEKFGYIGKRDMREMDVMILSVRNTAGRGLKRSSSQFGSSTSKSGEFSIVAQPISTLAGQLESQLRIPVIDRTGLKGMFDIEMKWDRSDSDRNRNLEEIKKAVTDQLGLQLVSSRERIEVLVVENTRNHASLDQQRRQP